MFNKRCCLLNSKTCMLTLDSELTFCVVYWQTKWNNQILNSMLAVLSTVWYLCYWTLKVDISWKFKLMFKLVLLNWIQINYENNQTWTLKFKLWNYMIVDLSYNHKFLSTFIGVILPQYTGVIWTHFSGVILPQYTGVILPHFIGVILSQYTGWYYPITLG